MRENRIVAFLLVIVLSCPALCFAGKSSSVQKPDSGLGPLIKKKVAPLKKVVRGERIYSTVLVESFYKARNYQPAWSEDGRLTQIEKLMIAVEESYDDGLTPDYYHLSLIRFLVGKTKKGVSAPVLMADLDILLTYLAGLSPQRSAGAESLRLPKIHLHQKVVQGCRFYLIFVNINTIEFCYL